MSEHSAHQRVKQAFDFLNSHFKSTLSALDDEFKIEFLLVRKRGSEKHVRTLLCRHKSVKKILRNVIERNVQGREDVYFGSCPRTALQKLKAFQQDIKHANAVWVDLDAGNKKPYKIFEEALSAIKGFPIEPTCIVSSGNGVHAYWYLNNLLSFDSYESGIGLRIRRVLKGLASALKGDNVCDLGRVLRLPGSLNFKGSPRECQVIEFSDGVYSLDDFRRYEMPVTESAEDIDLEEGLDLSDGFSKITRKREAVLAVENLVVPRDVKEMILNGDLQTEAGKDHTRSGRDFKIVRSLVLPFRKRKQPYNFKTVEELFFTRYLGCSNRVRERGEEGVKDLKRCYMKAWEEREIVLSENHINESSTRTIELPTNLEDLLTCEFEEDDELIGGGILPKRGVLLLAGDPKIGKSTLISQMCLDLISGSPFLSEFAIESLVRVLYIFSEGSKKHLQRLYRSQLLGFGTAGIQIDKECKRRLFVFNGRGLSLGKNEGIEQVKQLIGEFRVDVVVLDPICLFFDGDFNKGEVVAKLIRRLHQVAAECGTSFLIAHHFRKPRDKGDDQPMHRVLGSSAWVAYVDTFLGLENWSARRSEYKKRLHFVLRHAEEHDPLCLTFNRETRRFSISEEDAVITVSCVVNELGRYPNGVSYSDFTGDVASKFGVTTQRIAQLLAIAATMQLAFKAEGRNGKWFPQRGKSSFCAKG